MDAKALRDHGFVPYRLAVFVDGQVVELISFPHEETNSPPRIKYRVPGKPTTIDEVECEHLSLFMCKCCSCQSTFLPNVYTSPDNSVSTVHCPACKTDYHFKEDNWESHNNTFLELNTPVPSHPKCVMYAFTRFGNQYPVQRCPINGWIVGDQFTTAAILSPRDVASAFAKLAPLYRHFDFHLRVR